MSDIREAPKGGTPREIDNFTIMEAEKLPFFYEEAGTIKFEGGEWRIGRSLADLTVYLFTDFPHPDRPNQRAIYVMNAAPQIGKAAGKLIDLIAEDA